MKKILLILLSLMLILGIALCISACSGGSGDKAADTEETADAEDTEAQEEAPAEEAPAVVQSITDIDTEDMDDLPLQIESINLFEDGTVSIVPLDDLERNAESNDELVDGAMYPFAEEGEDARKVEKIYLVRFGNGGYRTIIALMDDGTLSAVSAKELIEDHIIVVMPNMTGRDNYTSVEQVEGEDGFSVTGVTEDGEEIELDYSLENF